MTGRQILPSLLVLAVSASVVAFVLTLDHVVPLVPVAEGPRPPVVADPGTTPLVLSGLRERLPETGNALRKRRNRLADEHRTAIDAWRRGKLSLRHVEQIEQLLWVAREQVGEIDTTALHTQLAELFERERQRLALLHERGLAGEDQLRRGALFVARERHLAGLPIGDPEGRDYERLRSAYLEAFRLRNQTLVEAGLASAEQVELDVRQLARDFPPLPELPVK